MKSKCPTCKKEHDHEDFLFEVVCSCGIRYNPFMQDTGGGPAAESTPLQELSADSGGGGLQNFSESNAAFQELREFGEGMGGGEPTAPSPKPSPSQSSSRSSGASTTISVTVGDEMAMTCGETLAGRQIEAVLTPVSAAADWDAGSEDPLAQVFTALWKRALSRGGNGIVGLRWSFSPDGKVVAAGTAIRCAGG